MTTILDEINKKIATEKQNQENRRQASQYQDGRKVDVARYLSDHGIPVVKEKEAPGGGTMFCLWACVFDENHSPNEAAIVQTEFGRLSYQCFHESCKGRTWADARRQISGDEKLGRWLTGGNGHQRPIPKKPDPTTEEKEEREAIREEGRGAYAQGKPEPVKPRFEFIHNADVLNGLHPIEWRIKDILVENAFYYNFGESGHFKTFVELDRCLCIASGIDYHGHKVKQGAVFYIAGEGQQGIGRRVAAWHAAHKTKARDVPFFIAKTPTQLMDQGAVDEVRHTIDFLSKEYGPPALVSIDTLARNFGEGDENATKDMNRVVSNMDSSFQNDFLRGLNHHTGHANKDRARGSIALHAAADTAFRVSLSPDGQVMVECTKMKDAKQAPVMLFDRREMLLQIGNTEDHSYVLELASEGDEAAAKCKPRAAVELKAGLAKAVDILRNLENRYRDNLKKGGRPNAKPMVSYADWRTACGDAGLYKRTDNFKRAFDAILLSGLVELDESKRFVQLREIICDGDE